MPRILIEPDSDWVEITTNECLFEVQHTPRNVGNNPNVQTMFSATTPTDIFFTLPVFSMRQFIPGVGESLWIRNKSNINISVVFQEV